MAEVMIPPWVLPESPETIRWIDDATIVFPPSFGRGFTQRGSWADPRWGLRRRYRGLSSEQKAAILACLNESRGQLNRILVTPHAPLRGSFPTSELLTNNTFASGTTGWTSSSEYTLSATDRALRATRNAFTASTNILISPAVTTVQYAPYVARFMVSQGRGAYGAGFKINDTPFFGTASTGFGLKTQAFVPNVTSDALAIQDQESSGLMAGDYLTIPFASYSRCALVDNGSNQLTRSDQIDDAAWTKTALTVVANNNTAPDGTVTGDALQETVANSNHQIAQSFTVTSAAQDICWCIAWAPGSRSWMNMVMTEATGSTSIQAYFNATTGVTGSTPAAGANWSNLRRFIVDIGNGWKYICIVARKTNAATTIQCRAHVASADGTDSYVGTAAVTAAVAWRATAALSSVPVRLMQTTSAAVAATVQVGSALYLKGLPASTNGLLEIGDWTEVAGQLKQTTARLNSDAAGLGYLQFRPALGDSPADNDPVTVYQPFGRFMYSGGQKELTNMFGVYGDIEMDLEEVYT
jgi:hypothetical protein